MSVASKYILWRFSLQDNTTHLDMARQMFLQPKMLFLLQDLQRRIQEIRCLSAWKRYGSQKTNCNFMKHETRNKVFDPLSSITLFKPFLYKQ